MVCTMYRKILVSLTRYLGFVRLSKKYYAFTIALISLFIIFEYYAHLIPISTTVDVQLTKTTHTSTLSSTSTIYPHCPKMCTENCDQSHSVPCTGRDCPSDNLIHKNQLVNLISIVLQTHSLMYCPVPKVATKTLINAVLYMHVRDINDHLDTNWKNVDADRARIEQMINIFGFIEDLRKNGIVIPKTKEPKSLAEFLRIYGDILRYGDINGTSSRYVNPWRLKFTFSFPYLRLNSLSSLSQLFSPSFTRMIFVRHPFERLASAYKERIATLKQDRIDPEPEYDAMREAICRRRLSSRQIRDTLPRRDACTGGVPTFEEFLRYILTGARTPAGIARMDYHWQPYSVLCQVCRFKYNFVGKYETFNDHFSDFLKLSNLSGWNVQARIGSSGLNRWDYQKFYTTLSDELICQLIRLYEQDFRIFKYRADDYINRTTSFQNCTYSFTVQQKQMLHLQSF